MKLAWNQDRCVGQGLCYGRAPELWDSDDEGYASLKITGVVPPELEDQARLSVKSCPEAAITLIE
jgi:ferredoxin